MLHVLFSLLSVPRNVKEALAFPKTFKFDPVTVNFGYKRFRYKGFSLIRDYVKGPK